MDPRVSTGMHVQAIDAARERERERERGEVHARQPSEWKSRDELSKRKARWRKRSKEGPLGMFSTDEGFDGMPAVSRGDCFSLSRNLL